MTIEIKFFTSDGEIHDTRRAANTHQRVLDARGMLENLLAQTFSAGGFVDDPERDSQIADMLYIHKDDVINLLKGKPATNPDKSPADVEAAAEAVAADMDDDATVIDLSDDELTLTIA
jgi:hypothetical protein